MNHKRKRVFVAILAAVVGNFIVTATPSPKIEAAKYIFLTFVNVVLFIIVWDTYFDEQMSEKSAISVLQDLLTITSVSLITTVIVTKGITKLIDSLTLAIGTFGLLIGGAIAGLATAILGLGWALYCDDLYRHST